MIGKLQFSIKKFLQRFTAIILDPDRINSMRIRNPAFITVFRIRIHLIRIHEGSVVEPEP